MTIKRIVTANEAAKPPKIDVASAIEELQSKSLEDIEIETAYKWASRAIAAWRLGKIEDAVTYHHEALEHASLIDDDFETLKNVAVEMSKERGKTDAGK